MKIGDFATRPACNDGLKIPLVNPVTGETTEEWVLIRGVDSDVFRAKESEIKRRLVTMDDVSSVESELEAELISSLIIDWSLDDECNDENKLLLCRDAPLIAQDINRKAANRRAFLEKK